MMVWCKMKHDHGGIHYRRTIASVWEYIPLGSCPKTIWVSIQSPVWQLQRKVVDRMEGGKKKWFLGVKNILQLKIRVF